MIGKLGAELLGPGGSRFSHRLPARCRRDLGVYASCDRGVKQALSLRRPPARGRLRDVQQLFVLFHSPGAGWDPALGFMEQPGIEQHIAFMRSLTDRGLMVLGGPFSDADASGPVGMAVITAPDAAQAERLAREDRSVESGLIRVRVRPWTVPMGYALETIQSTEEG